MKRSGIVPLPVERAVWYIGSSRDDLAAFPAAVKQEVLTALEVARLGGKHDSAKPWHGAMNVFEIAVNDRDAYRTLYWARFREAIYVLHAFQKKSTQGVKTPQREIMTIDKRLAQAKRHYEETYGSRKTN